MVFPCRSKLLSTTAFVHAAGLVSRALVDHRGHSETLITNLASLPRSIVSRLVVLPIDRAVFWKKPHRLQCFCSSWPICCEAVRRSTDSTIPWCIRWAFFRQETDTDAPPRGFLPPRFIALRVSTPSFVGLVVLVRRFSVSTF